MNEKDVIIAKMKVQEEKSCKRKKVTKERKLTLVRVG